MHVKSIGKRVPRLALGVFAAFCVVVLCGYLVWANQPLALEPNDHPLPEPNGFVLAMDAASRLSPTPNGSPIANRGFTAPRVLREKLAPDEGNLNNVRKSLGVEWGIPTIQDNTQKFPYLAAFREAARKFAAESRLALAEGRAGDAIERSLDAVELGARMGHRAPLIHFLAGLSASAIGVDQADRVAPTLSAAQAQQAGARLDRILAAFPTASEAFREERWVTLSTLLRIYRNELDLRSASAEQPGGAQRGTPPWFLYPKPWTYRAVDRWFQAHLAETEKPYRARAPLPLPRDYLAHALIPSLDRALLAAEKNRASLAILRLELALQEYRGRHGAYPSTLAALSPEIIPTVPVDPYGGESLLYQTGMGGYRLYSVGPNLKDDGGNPLTGDYTRPHTEGDLVAGQLGYRKSRTEAQQGR
jgi:hypothetical protein